VGPHAEADDGDEAGRAREEEHHLRLGLRERQSGYDQMDSDAAAAAAREGFAPRSTVFLDIERMERMPPAMREYYSAWARALLKDARYRPAYTCTPGTRRSCTTTWSRSSPPRSEGGARIWVATGHGFDEGKAPQDVGFAFAGVWQGMIDVARRVADIRLPVDVNVSSCPLPRSPARTPVD